MWICQIIVNFHLLSLRQVVVRKREEETKHIRKIHRHIANTENTLEKQKIDLTIYTCTNTIYIQKPYQWSKQWENGLSGLWMDGGMCNYCYCQVQCPVQCTFSVVSLLVSCDLTGASSVFAASAAQSVRGNVQPGRCPHLHAAQCHSPHGAGQRSAGRHTRWRHLQTASSYCDYSVLKWFFVLCASALRASENVLHSFGSDYDLFNGWAGAISSLWYVRAFWCYIVQCIITHCQWYIIYVLSCFYAHKMRMDALKGHCVIDKS